MINKIVYGKDETENVVAVEVKNGIASLFIENNGVITIEEREHDWWMLHKNPAVTGKTGQLKDDRTFKYYSKFDTNVEFREAIKRANYKDYFACKDADMSFMMKSGVTPFKGMQVKDVSILSFDIETNGLARHEDSTVFLISNTLRTAGKVTRKLFRVDEYSGCRDMINAWCDWVREVNPSILTGHNIYSFDLPYLEHCSKSGLVLGRDDSRAYFEAFTRRFRKDGSQSYEYNQCHVYGRQIIDTFFLSIKYDIARNYPSYRLKEIIDYEGLTKEKRTFYDASKIRADWYDPSRRADICAYCEDDSDDSLALFDLMAPSFFYYNRSVPMDFQNIINTATGKQVNSILCRAYVQDGRSLPEATTQTPFKGAISDGYPGLYKHVNKVDVASLYPSIIITEGLFNKGKDPEGYFLKIATYMTEERLGNKAKAKESGDRYYSALEQAQKIVINSLYGFMGAPGLNFNYPIGAELVTRRGREILQAGIKWANDNEYALVNLDTDSFSYTTGKKLTDEEFQEHIDQVNNLSPDGIIWEDDGRYKAVLVVAAKNYVLEGYKKGQLKVKGSGLKATMKEPMLREFIDVTIHALISGKKEVIYDLYHVYVHKISSITDVTPWCSKKTVTEAVLNPNRTTEQRILDAIGKTHVQEGDKIFVFFEESDRLCLRENYTGTIHKPTLYKKLYKTLEIFSNVMDVGMIPNYSLARNTKRIEVDNETSVVNVFNSDERKRLRSTKAITVREGKGQSSKSASKNS